MLYDFLEGKSVLVTGGTGSFGQRFVKGLLEKSKASKVVVFSRDELKQSRMESSIPDSEGRLRFFLGDVRDERRLERAFHGVDFVVHAAALKQVPLLEYNPFEAIKTNVVGTQNVINAAIDKGVKKVLFISTDKAANPANLYGATKLCAEKLIISGNAYSGNDGTRFGVVRYGNVFGSRGSVVELIEQQRSSGRIKITHREMTRFWITLDQGVDLVLLALENMYGGEIFVPKMPSMKVEDLFKMLAPECAVEEIGLRPGEKLHEVLVTPEEVRHTKEYDSHYVILPEHKWWKYREHYHDAKDLSSDFYYASHLNSQWIDEEGMARLRASL